MPGRQNGNMPTRTLRLNKGALKPTARKAIKRKVATTIRSMGPDGKERYTASENLKSSEILCYTPSFMLQLGLLVASFWGAASVYPELLKMHEGIILGAARKLCMSWENKNKYSATQQSKIKPHQSEDIPSTVRRSRGRHLRRPEIYLQGLPKSAEPGSSRPRAVRFCHHARGCPPHVRDS